MLIYAVRKRKNERLQRDVLAKNVIYDTMMFYVASVKPIEERIEHLKGEIKELYGADKARGEEIASKKNQILKLTADIYKCKDKAVECAKQLAPYQSPKLESLEVKSKVEHRYVIRAPQSIKSVEEWKKITGAEELKVDEVRKHLVEERKIQPLVEDIHDEDDAREYYNGKYTIN